MTPPTLLYLIGVPGSGKSTTVAALLAGTIPYEVQAGPLVLTEHHGPAGLVAAQLGRLRPTHPGTDALSFSVLPAAVAWIGSPQANSYPLIVGEGDRLAHPTFWAAAERAGRRVVVACLDVDADTVAARLTRRGTSQDPLWLAGRVSRVKNLTRQWPVVHIDATGSAAEVAAAVAAHLPRQARPSHREEAAA